MSFTAHSLDVAAVAPATTPIVQGRQDLYRDAVQRARSVSYFGSCDLAHNFLPSEKRGPCANWFQLSLLSPHCAIGFGISRREKQPKAAVPFAWLPPSTGMGIAAPCLLDLGLPEDLVE